MKKISILLITAMLVLTANAKIKVIKQKGKETIQGLPEGYEIAYFVKDSARSLYFLIIGPKKLPEHGCSYGFELYTGHVEKNLIQKNVYETVRYKDGGTTYIETEVGMFYFQTPLAWHRLSALFNKTDTTRLIEIR